MIARGLSLTLALAAALGAQPESRARAAEPLRFESHQPGNVFLENTAPRFYLTAAERFSGSWEVRDYHGQSVASREKIEITPGDRALILPALPCGYYTLEIRGAAARPGPLSVPFAIVTPPVANHAGAAAGASSPFALDTAFTWLVRGGEGRPKPPVSSPAEAAARLIELTGVQNIRERLSWSEVNPAPGEFHWEPYEANAKLLSAHGLSVLDVFHDAPAWSRDQLDSLPRDLLALAAFTEAAARRLGKTVDAWEFWNEPDSTAYCADSAWDFASAQKAAYIGWKRASPNAKVLPGSRAAALGSRFFDVVMDNLGGEYFDIQNLHAYGPPAEYPAMLREARAADGRSGSAGKPVWVTETGLREEGAGRAETSRAGNVREHDIGQERAQAEFLVKSLVTLLSLGAERSYYFILPPYNENSGAKVWGLLRWDWTVKPAYCALATLMRQTAGHDYAGTVDLGEGVSGFLFARPGKERGSDQTLVVWARKPARVRLAGADSQSRRIDIVGSEEPLLSTQDSKVIEVGTEPLYLAGLSRLTADTPPVKVDASSPAPAIPVVLSLQLASRGTIHNRVAVDIPDGSRWTLGAWNLSDKPRQVALNDLSRGISVEGLPRKVNLAPMTGRQIPLDVTRIPSMLDARLSISGVSEGETVAPVVVPLFPSADALRSLAASAVNLRNLSLWKVLAPARVEAVSTASDDGIVFSAHFPASVTDRWLYPEYAIAPQMLAGSEGIAFEIRAVENPESVEKAHVIFPGSTTDAGKQLLPIKVTAEWRQVCLLWRYDAPASFDPSRASAMQIGCNVTSGAFGFAVRNLRVLRRSASTSPRPE